MSIFFFLEKLQQQCKKWCYFLYSSLIEKHSQAIKLLLSASYDTNNYPHVALISERKSTPQGRHIKQQCDLVLSHINWPQETSDHI